MLDPPNHRHLWCHPGLNWPYGIQGMDIWVGRIFFGEQRSAPSQQNVLLGKSYYSTGTSHTPQYCWQNLPWDHVGSQSLRPFFQPSPALVSSASSFSWVSSPLAESIRRGNRKCPYEVQAGDVLLLKGEVGHSQTLSHSYHQKDATGAWNQGPQDHKTVSTHRSPGL